MRPLLRSSLFVLALLVHHPALAVDDGTKEAPPADDISEGSITYSGVGLSRVSVDDHQVDSNTRLIFDGAISLNAVLGFRIPTLPSFGVELEIAGGVFPAEVKIEQCRTVIGGGGGVLGPILGGGGNSSTTCDQSDGGDFATTTAGVYAVYRSPGRWYGMGKIGYRYADVSFSDFEVEDFPVERTGTAYAAGFGYRWSPRKHNGAELFYNKTSDEISYYGFNFSYGFGGRD